MDSSIQSSPSIETTPLTHQDIASWLVTYLAEVLNIAEHKLDSTVPFDKFGLDSVSAARLSGDLMDWLQCEVDPSTIYEHPSIDQLAAHLLSITPDGRGRR